MYHQNKKAPKALGRIVCADWTSIHWGQWAQIQEGQKAPKKGGGGNVLCLHVLKSWVFSLEVRRSWTSFLNFEHEVFQFRSKHFRNEIDKTGYGFTFLKLLAEVEKMQRSWIPIGSMRIRHTARSSVADLGCLSRISNPGYKYSNKREVWKKISCHTFFCSHKLQKMENYFIFLMLKKKFGPVFKEL